MYTLTLKGDRLYIYTTDDLPELKEIGMRRSKSVDAYYIKLYISAINTIQRVLGDYVTLSPEVQQVLDYPDGFPLDKVSLNKRVARLWNRAMKFQRKAFVYLVSSRRPGALLNMDPGLGKTFTSVMAAGAIGQDMLILCPLTLMEGWKKEILDAFPDDFVELCHGSVPVQQSLSDSMRHWVIANYDTAINNPEWFYLPWSILIFDESLAVKNRRTKRSTSLRNIRKYAKRVWLLSGSPVSKFADDLWGQFSIIDPKAFTSYWRFAREYCVVTTTPWGDKVTGNRKSIDFASEFRDIMFTAKIHDVMEELTPNFHIIESPMEMHQSEIYVTMRDDFVAELETTTVETIAIGSKLARLQQIVSHPLNLDEGWRYHSGKESSTYDVLLADDAKFPFIIWTWFTKTAEHLEKSLANFRTIRAARITGSTSLEERNEILRKYQEGEYNVLILSLAVGKYGLTLPKTGSVIYYDRTFDADAYIQSMARVSAGLRGLGRTEPVEVFILHSPNTTDELIERNLTRKAFSMAHTTQGELARLLKQVKGK